MFGKSKLYYMSALAAIFFYLVFIYGCAQAERVEPQLIRLAAPEEYVTAPDGLEALEGEYDFHFDEVYVIAMGLTHEALRAGDVDAALGYATDGKIMELELIALIDDRDVFPSRNAAPVVNQDILALYPEIESAYADIRPHINNRAMIRLNYLVDIKEYPLEKAVEEWFEEKDIPEGKMVQGKMERPLIIGTKGFIEQEILVQIMAVSLGSRGIEVEIVEYPAGIRAARSALLDGKIDLYWEYTGAAWREFFAPEAFLEYPDDFFAEIREKDAELGLIWLDYAPLNNTHALLMRRELAVESGIFTISSFARWARTIQEDQSQPGE